MPTRFAGLDAGFPTFTGGESLEQKVDALQNYNYMLLEYLRYILRNLGPENFNDAELLEWIGRNIRAETVVSNTVITNELYSEYGAIADLVVDELRTDYAKAARYLTGDESPIDYLHIHDEEIDFLTGTVATEEGEPLTEQLHHGSRYFWWTDAGMTQMTSLETTAWPVTVYRYEELTKASFHFADVTLRDGTVTRMPVLRMGAGDGRGRDYVELRKDVGEFLIRYVSAAGNTDISLTDFVDAKHRRLASCSIDSGSGTVSYTVEGDETEYGLTFTVDGDTVTYTWPDGHECEVNVV